MSPKKTYLKDTKIRRQPQYLAYWEGYYAVDDDADMPEELAAIIQDARASFSFKKTPAGDIRETLRGLSQMMNGAKIRQAVQVMDEFTKAHLCTAAGRVWRKENPDPETPVPDDLFNLKSWRPDYIRKMAKEALGNLPEVKGRHSTQQRDVEFAARLAAYWQKDTGERASVSIKSDTSPADSNFVQFAVKMFHRAGRSQTRSYGKTPLTAAALSKILRQACEAVNNP